MERLNSLVDAISERGGTMFQKDFLLTWDKTAAELEQVLLVAEALLLMRKSNRSTRCFDSGLAISIFRDQSTRTRFSFAMAANLLGLGTQDLDEAKSQIAHGETVRETANMISFLTEVIGIRDDIYLGAGHTYMQAVGDALTDGFENDVLTQRPSVINLQCDVDHPTQAMADLLHLKRHFGALENLKGKKLVMSWAYSPSYGKPLSVPQGVIGLMTRFGMDVVLAHPPGYRLISEVLDLAEKNADVSGGKFTIVESMEAAFDNADVVYPKSWAPYAVMEERARLLRTGDTTALQLLEKKGLAENARFVDWECDETKMKRTRGGRGLYMHCLPADISGVSCRAGEVQKTVFDCYRIDTYRQAGFKPYIIAAMILASRFENPANILKTLMKGEAIRYLV